MKLQNISQRAYMHEAVILRPGETADIPQRIAEIWLKSDDIVKYASPIDAEKLKDENTELKAEIEKLKAESKGEEVEQDEQKIEQVEEIKPKKATPKKKAKKGKK